MRGAAADGRKQNEGDCAGGRPSDPGNGAVPADFEQVLRWMTDPETMRFWEGMTEIYDLARVQAEYRESLAEHVVPCLVEWNGRAIACYRKCGFRDCCVVPQREKQDGILHDSLIMARHA